MAASSFTVAPTKRRRASAVSARPHASELVSLAERYEVADDERLAGVANAADRFEPAEVKSEAAEPKLVALKPSVLAAFRVLPALRVPGARAGRQADRYRS